jgi:hypothetical protein
MSFSPVQEKTQRPSLLALMPSSPVQEKTQRPSLLAQMPSSPVQEKTRCRRRRCAEAVAAGAVVLLPGEGGDALAAVAGADVVLLNVLLPGAEEHTETVAAGAVVLPPSAGGGPEASMLDL